MTLREVQLSVLQILKDIDTHCQKNHIKYSLAFGTLLGAIRHNGFIPWDDDLDIYMPRDDYNRFLNTWNYEQYYLDNLQTNPNCTNTFTKVKRVQNRNSETPFFVDVFPLDKCPRHKIARKIQQLYGIILVLMSRRNVPLERGSFVEKIVKIFLKAIPCSLTVKICRIMENKFAKYYKLSNDFDYYSCSILHNVYWFKPADFFENLQYHKFEDAMFPIIKDFDWYLKKEYGDYMQLPPIEKRVSPHFDNLH